MASEINTPVHLDKARQTHFQELGERDWGIFVRAILRQTTAGASSADSGASDRVSREEAVVRSFVDAQPGHIKEALLEHKMCCVSPLAPAVITAAFEADAMSINDVTQPSATCAFNTRIVHATTTCKCVTFFMGGDKRKVFVVHVFYTGLLHMIRIVAENKSRCQTIIRQWVAKNSGASEATVVDHADLLLCRQSYNQAIQFLYIFVTNFIGTFLT